ncbi:MAG: helix-turn-helix domain-containing protein [Bacteroidales bacterium]|nr:helix-turn-helix domain-containing protein [Bacteroidales bacterium]
MRQLNKKWREHFALTQTELAARMGVSQTAVAKHYGSAGNLIVLCTQWRSGNYENKSSNT